MKNTTLGKVLALLLTVVLLAGLLPVMALAVDPTDSNNDGYNDNDLTKIKAFLSIEDASHITNLKKINPIGRIDDPATWTGVTWTTDAIKSIKAINILPGKGLTGVLDLSDAVKLESLDCWENALTGLNLSGAVSLQAVDCHYNQLSGIVLTGTSALTTLFCSFNNMSSLNCLDATALTSLYCNDNKLSSLNCSSSKDITSMSCANNPLKILRANLLGHAIVLSSTSAGTIGAALTGSNFQLFASPVAEESHFANWTEGATVLSAADDYTIDLSQRTAGTSLDISGNFSHLVSFVTSALPLTGTDKYVDDGNLVTPPADPTWAGYEFGGWYTVDGHLSLVSLFDFNTPIHGSTLLLAKWSKTYTVSATVTGGSVTPSKTDAIAGDTINLTVTPDAGKQLKAGSLKYNDGTEHTIAGTSFTMPAANVTVTAEFEDATTTTISSANAASIPAKGGTFQVTATGTGTLTYSLLTDIPSNVSIDPSTGLITMTALFPYAGTDKTFTLTVSNGTAPDATQDFTLTILDTPYIVTAGLETGTVGKAYSCAPDAMGGGTITWSLSGTLPVGLTLSGSTISGTPTAAGDYPLTFTATNTNGSDTATFTLKINAAPSVNTGGGPVVDSNVTITTIGSGRDAVTTAGAPIPGTTVGGVQTVPVPADTMTSLTDAVKKAEAAGGKAIASIDTSSGAGLGSVNLTIPGTQFAAFASGTGAALEIKSGLGSVAFSSGAVDAISAAGSGDVSFGIAVVSPSALNAAQQAVVGNRPVYSLSVAVGGKPISEFGSSVAVTLPYTLKTGEDPNAVVVYYLDGAGQLQTMQGQYDASTGTVTFETTHFSAYVIGYNKVSFTDVSATAWYGGAVTFLSARSITSGTTATTFSPDATLTRGQFITMLLRAYGVTAVTNPMDNFSDAGSTYYTGYLAAARKLGITIGVGDNKFAPDSAITRQEMFTLLYNALKRLDKLPTSASSKTLSDFADAGGVASWASDAMTALVRAGTVTGDGGKLNPTGKTTRAEMAQLLYNLLGRHK